eukprot:TRINITY_DN22124_c0_g1_i1.p2 TRINITY_DN22124_c0_g1~~TRINITY_DN22124_c0_g1_i1.p2  ORF type:complete len:128 (+),score=51.39 TRINITY_DN22124_c0_g1_i1:51-434(+)
MSTDTMPTPEAGTLEKKDSNFDVSTSPMQYKRARSMFEDEMTAAKEEKPIERKGSAVRIPKAKGGKYTYADLKMPGSQLTKDQIDVTARETYLGSEEFAEVFGMPEEEFYKLAKWKQADKKKAKGLF